VRDFRGMDGGDGRLMHNPQSHLQRSPAAGRETVAEYSRPDRMRGRGTVAGNRIFLGARLSGSLTTGAG